MVAPNYSFQKRQKELEKKRKKEEKLKLSDSQEAEVGDQPPATPESAG
jgi:hypothetical protein